MSSYKFQNFPAPAPVHLREKNEDRGKIPTLPVSTRQTEASNQNYEVLGRQEYFLTK